MAKIEIMDNCLAPEKDIFVKYEGPNPWDIAKKISSLQRPFFHVSSTNAGWTRLNWDRSGENIDFFSLWWVKKPVSGYTYMRFDIKVQGSQNKSTNEGHFNLTWTANMFTKFEGWGLFLKPLWYIYSYLYYDKVRKSALERCREYSLGFLNEIKEHFGMKTTTYGPSIGTMG